MKKIIIIHYHEIGLKGKNRSFFEGVLFDNIKKSLKSEKISRVVKMFGRILVFLNEDSDLGSIKDKLQKVFGIAYFAIGFEGSKDLEGLQMEIWDVLSDKKFASYRITAKRSDKSFKMTSQEIDAKIGSYVWEQIGKTGGVPKVDLKNPEMNVVIEITQQGTFFYLRESGDSQSEGKVRGLSGFPPGVSGNVLSLISSGFDSPVASWKMMRRGADVSFVHFHSYPTTSLASKENVREIIKTLTRYQFHSKAYFVPFLDVQKAIMLNCDPAYGVILYRRFMVRIASELAKRENIKAIVTGDSLGQVASQTLENMAVVSRASDTLIFRPLIGENKEDIIELAEKIGTFDSSSRPYEDCCSLFVPKHPKTKARLEEVEAMENKLDVSKLIEEALAKTEVEFFDY